MRAGLALLALLLAVASWAQTQPQTTPEDSKRLRLRDGEMEKRLIHRVEPEYPPLAKKARIQGIVRLEIVVGTDGLVRETRVISGHPLLTQAAVDAVRQWRYKPIRWKGELVAVVTTVELSFVLAKREKREPQLRPA